MTRKSKANRGGKWVIDSIYDAYDNSIDFDEEEGFASKRDAINAAKNRIECVHLWNDDNQLVWTENLTAHYRYTVCHADNKKDCHQDEYVLERDPDNLGLDGSQINGCGCGKLHKWKGLDGSESGSEVWCGPGTEYYIKEKCDDCQMQRAIVRRGSQRKFGEEDYVEFYPARRQAEEEVEEEIEP